MIDYQSRYYEVETATLTSLDGREHRYLRRRFVPAPAQSSPFSEHLVVQGDRLDNLTARYLGEPELFWRICDANNAMKPETLVSVIGRKLRIASPVGEEA